MAEPTTVYLTLFIQTALLVTVTLAVPIITPVVPASTEEPTALKFQVTPAKLGLETEVTVKVLDWTGIPLIAALPAVTPESFQAMVLPALALVERSNLKVTYLV